MSDPSPGARAVVAYEIEDVVLIECGAKLARDFNPTMFIKNVQFAHRTWIDGEVLSQDRVPVADGEQYHLLRYFLSTEVHLLKPDVIPKEEPTAEDFMASFNFVFAIDYRCAKEATADLEAIGSFTANAQFHAWPFVREEIHTMCGRLRIPRLTIPMLKLTPVADSAGYSGPQPLSKE
ncbi:MAG TPA: hypothetical protein VK641_15195 [Terriglobales bacterium]|nr:hypothetical protein [Terriglobales bacterium]